VSGTSSCGFQNKANAPPAFSFHVEPILLRVSSKSLLRNADIIEAVDGHPITTREGSDAFTYPDTGLHVITLRRAGKQERLVLEAMCEPGTGSSGSTPAGVVIADSTGAATITGVKPAPSASQSRFGLAVSCTPSCTKVRASDGTSYWKYDGYPSIAAVRPESPAELAGLRKNDVVTKVDGLSVLDEAGALKLFRSESAASLRLTILRAGKELEIRLEAK
jgi:C-terminal processing protease CtpA/Prc